MASDGKVIRVNETSAQRKERLEEARRKLAAIGTELDDTPQAPPTDEDEAAATSILDVADDYIRARLQHQECKHPESTQLVRAAIASAAVRTKVPIRFGDDLDKETA